MWIARDKDGTLRLFRVKPFRLSEGDDKPTLFVWDTDDDADYECMLDSSLFPDLKWKDEPMEVDIVPIKELLETERELKDVYHKLINYQTAIIQLRNNMKTLDGDMRKWIDENFLDLTIE